MFKIGDFSKISRVAVSALRYYDEVGLLKPISIDRHTGYRFYSMSQLPRLNRILALKELGLSLEQVSKLIDDDLPTEEIREMLERQQRELVKRVHVETERLARVEVWLRQIEMEGKMPEYEIVLKATEPQTVAFARGKVEQRRLTPVTGAVLAQGDLVAQIGKECDILAKRLSDLIRQKRVKGMGPWALIYEQNEEDIELEMAAPVQAGISPGGGPDEGERLGIRAVPGQPSVASVIHNGPYETLPQAYTALGLWIEQNGYELAGPCWEIYLHHDGRNPSECVTEVQFPVEKR